MGKIVVYFYVFEECYYGAIYLESIVISINIVKKGDFFAVTKVA